ncbi:PfkB family carbohydrate kinase [Acuticoccus sp. MNP-M23]|uniref:PfkB family carbohydrate kinase n=1 Tax=Acuticoccus sp. MNP-M23 TaxID=3072793 RepID=UPI0028159A7E|nr:PfkB family carbohydrate kinase [Acuticoccus sp. MNP-M23]WMS44990.1 PfkB family carbohydrate kinase [Acuticoccus sp. MNP-M23]
MPEGEGDDIVYRPVLGGSHYTVAVGIAKLGGKAGYLWELSHDTLGQRFFASLCGAGVDCSAVRRADRATPTAIVDMSGDEPRYNIADPDRVMHDTALPPLPAGATCLHVGSAVLAQDPVGGHIAEAARLAPLVSLDINARAPSITDRAAYCGRLRKIAAFSGVVKASVADIELIGEGDAEKYMKARVDDGAAIAILTMAEGGALAMTAQHRVWRKSCATAVRDPVGAGDAFMAALLFRLQQTGTLSKSALSALSEDSLGDLLDFAQLAAAFTCGHHGAVMPTADDLARARSVA